MQKPNSEMLTPSSASLRTAERALAQGRTEEAKAILDRLIAGEPDHLSALELRAQLAWRAGELAKVRKIVRQLLRLNPYEPGYHLLLASALRAEGKYGEAERSLRRAGNREDRALVAEELRAWQQTIVGSLLASDAAFRAAYRRNARQACAMRGLGVPSTQPQLVVLGRTERTTISVRPS